MFGCCCLLFVVCGLLLADCCVLLFVVCGLSVVCLFARLLDCLWFVVCCWFVRFCLMLVCCVPFVGCCLLFAVWRVLLVVCRVSFVV